MTVKADRAVAPQRGMKADLRQRGVQGRPRPVSFARRNERPYDWGRTPPRSALREAVDFVLFAGVFVGVALLALHVAMGGGL